MQDKYEQLAIDHKENSDFTLLWGGFSVRDRLINVNVEKKAWKGISENLTEILFVSEVFPSSQSRWHHYII